MFALSHWLFRGAAPTPLPLPRHKQVLVMRKDLGMRRGKQIAQGAHASLAAVLTNRQHPAVVTWLSQAFTKTCVYVESLEELGTVVRAAQAVGLITAVITDSGLTEFSGVPTVTCAAVGPAPVEAFTSITDHLRLL